MKLADKQICTGCAACYSICVPWACISMKEDAEGFLYPVVDEKKCTQCKQCERICPAIVQGKERKPLNVYAAKNPNEEIRKESSSGGMFTLLAEHVINEGGVVFGARFNADWEVVHDYTETIQGLAAFRGSKYVQSEIGDMYIKARYFLSTGRTVLFSGTPCQIAGLKAFLQKDYDNLLTVDLVCHGVPSPLVWKKYLEEVISKIISTTPPNTRIVVFDIKFRDKIYGWKPLLTFSISFIVDKSMDIKNISIIKFRDKRHGWGKNHFTITSFDKDKKTVTFIENSNINSFMKGFLQNLYLRPSCYNCQAKSFRSGSDITIADYWGIQNVLPEFDDEKGVSLVMVNTEKGREIYALLDKDEQETTYIDAFTGNSVIEKSALEHKKRTLFFEKFNTEAVIPLIDRLTADSLPLRLKKMVVAFLRRLKIHTFVKIVLKKINKV